jgi:hypothetical protein
MSMIPKSGHRFSVKIMLQKNSFNSRRKVMPFYGTGGGLS